MEKNYLISNAKANELYEKYAKALPIIDYHNHLSVPGIAEDLRYTDIYTLWLKPDPYKHRVMRMCGVEEKYITGDARPFDKFSKWCAVFPRLIGHPLYIWSVCELYEVFGIEDRICEENAFLIWKKANAYLENNVITPSVLLKKFNAELVCPCALLTDDIYVFEKCKNAVPSLRGDNMTSPDMEFIRKLEARVGKITDLSSYKKALSVYLDDFKSAGCVYTDHALDDGFRFIAESADDSFNALLNGSAAESDKVKIYSDILLFLGCEYAKRGFTMQLHMGAKRETSTRLRTLAGVAGGFAAIGTDIDISSLTKYFDLLEQTEYGIPKTVLFTLNPAYNYAVSVLSGSYSKDGVAGLITQGPAWWWCDHKNGITEVLESLSAFGLLSNFIGMTTDSRSILSFVRHDYFRRILCSFLAEKLEKHEIICEEKELEELIYAVCYGNAKRSLEK